MVFVRLSFHYFLSLLRLNNEDKQSPLFCQFQNDFSFLQLEKSELLAFFLSNQPQFPCTLIPLQVQIRSLCKTKEKFLSPFVVHTPTLASVPL